jgi:U1 small nuclear ribonucleoprotein
MTCNLPPNILRLFAPRPPLYWLPSSDRDYFERTGQKIGGVGEYLHCLKEGFDKDYVCTVSHMQVKKERVQKKKQKYEKSLEIQKKDYNPHNIKNGTKDPYKTLFVGRLSQDVTEDILKKEFERFGKLENIVMINSKAGKFRGYCFIEYWNERDMKTALRQMNGYKLLGKRIIVDVERGRTVSGWVPTRLGVSQPSSSRPLPSSNSLTQPKSPTKTITTLNTGFVPSLHNLRDNTKPRPKYIEQGRNDYHDRRGSSDYNKHGSHYHHHNSNNKNYYYNNHNNSSNNYSVKRENDHGGYSTYEKLKRPKYK